MLDDKQSDHQIESIPKIPKNLRFVKRRTFAQGEIKSQNSKDVLISSHKNKNSQSINPEINEQKQEQDFELSKNNNMNFFLDNEETISNNESEKSQAFDEYKKNMINIISVNKRNDNNNRIFSPINIKNELADNKNISLKTGIISKKSKQIQENQQNAIILVNSNSSLNLSKKNLEDNVKEFVLRENFECLFCEKIFSKNSFSAQIKCGHFFCKKCGETFYKNLINKGLKNNFKCPIITCNNKYSDNFIKSLNSKNKNDLKEINYINKNKIIKQNTNIIPEYENDYFYEQQLNFQNYNQNNKENLNQDNYLKKNILDINTNDIFQKNVAKIALRCPSCNECTLYGNIDRPFLKCLKCQKKYCKFCHKLYQTFHFDISNENHCKVYYRIKKKISRKKNFFYLYFINLLLTIGAFLIITSLFIVKAKKEIYNIKRNTIQKILLVIFYCLLTIICLPVCILFLPYFPIINNYY